MSQPSREPSKEAASSKHKCCLGTLYYSQSRHDRLKTPVCVGFAKRLKGSEDPVELTTDSIPGGDFKYLCFGYSAYSPEELQKAAQKRNSPTDPVQLPYCEGLEVVSAAAMSNKPELLTDGPGLPSSRTGTDSGEESNRDLKGGETRQRPGRRFAGRPDFPAEGMDWDKFKERFDRMAGRIVNKMQANGSFMVSSFKKSWQQVIKELGGGGGKDDSSSGGG